MKRFAPTSIKNKVKLWQRQHWCISTVGTHFIWRMEDVLDLYAEPYALLMPVVCVDGTLYQLITQHIDSYKKQDGLESDKKIKLQRWSGFPPKWT